MIRTAIESNQYTRKNLEVFEEEYREYDSIKYYDLYKELKNTIEGKIDNDNKI